MPLLAGLLLAAKYAHVVPPDAPLVLAAAAAMLAAAVFAAVYHAEVLALKLGEPFGSILLAVAVTVIEVALIASLMFSGAPGSEMVARDTVFAAMMIVLNGVVGLCLVLGASRHFEQGFQVQGASWTLSVLGTLAVISFVLPNFTQAVPGPIYAPVQLVAIGVVSLLLWAVFVFVQTIRHRDYFLDTDGDEDAAIVKTHADPGAAITGAAAVLLLVSLSAVVLLAKVLSLPIDAAVKAAGLPQAVVGIIIAAVVLLPEGVASVKSALANRLQNSINLALGSAVASIGLTIPTVALLALLLGLTPSLGLSPQNTTLLLLTLFVSAQTFSTGRTSVLQGAVHLVVFSVFLLISAVP